MARGDNENFNLLRTLRHSEPLVVVASLLLVIAAFTSEDDELDLIYSHSVVSGFLFIISFVISIIYDVFRFFSRDSPDPAVPIIEVVLRIGIYVFFSLGMIYLILVAYEFAGEHIQLSAYPSLFLYSFVGATYVSLYYLK